MNEYAYKQKACIRNKQPDCETQAVIPSITVETVDGITNLANCLVHVTSTNTTYYVDDKHRVMITWAGPVNIPGYDMKNNPNHYKNQIVTDTEAETAVIYDNNGKGYIFGITSEDLQTAVNEKLDEMAQDGTLSEIIGEYIQGESSLIFPRYIKLGTDTLGDCTIFKTATKSLMVDAFINDAEVYSGIVEALSSNSISHLDYFILSHYHSDHFGNIPRLISDGYITDTTTVILPNEVHNDYINISGSEVKAYFNNANIPYTLCNNQTFEFDDATVSLCNGSVSDIDYLNSQDDRNYNDYSIVTKIFYKDRKMLITGDLDGKGIVYVASTYLDDGPYDIVKDCHHGFANFNQTFVSKTYPKNVVVPTSYGMIEHNLGYRGSLRAAWQNCNSRIFIQGEQPEALTFRVSDFGIRVDTNAMTVQQPSAGYRHSYYVDANTTAAIRDGSDRYPFKDLSEAAMMMPKTSRVRLTVRSNLSNTAHVTFQGFNSLYVVFDNYTYSSTDGIIYFVNNGVVRIEKFNSSDSRIYCEENGTVIFQDFTCSKPDNQISVYNSIVSLLGDFTVTNSSSSNASFSFQDCLVGVRFDALTYNGSGASMINGRRSTISVEYSCVARIAAYGNFDIFSKTTMRSCVMNYLDDFNTLYSSDTTEYAEGELNMRPDEYSALKVTYSNPDGYAYEVTVPTKTSNTFTFVLHTSSNNVEGTNLYQKYTMVSISNTQNKFTLVRQLNFTHDLANNAITPHPEQDAIGIRKIVGII